MKMKEAQFLYSSSPRAASPLVHLFHWPVCALWGHRWVAEERWEILQQALVECRRCGRAQFLVEIPDHWDGTHESKRVGDLEALAAVLYAVVSVFAIMIGLAVLL